MKKILQHQVNVLSSSLLHFFLDVVCTLIDFCEIINELHNFSRENFERFMSCCVNMIFNKKNSKQVKGITKCAILTKSMLIIIVNCPKGALQDVM